MPDDLRIDRDKDRPNLLHLVADGVVQATIDLDDPSYLDAEYMQRIAYLVDAVGEPGRPLRALHLGAGGLAMARYIAVTRPGSYQQAVETNRALVELVRAEAPLPRGVKVKIRHTDAREAIETAPEDGYELIVTDVYADARVPAHVTSTEFLHAARRVLRADGHYAVNLCDGGQMRFLKPALAAMREVWPHVAIMGEPAVLRGRRFGNVVAVAAGIELPVAELRRRCAGAAFPCRVLEGTELKEYLAGAAPTTDATAIQSPPPPRSLRSF
ncbi:fused MFS/spermidine synthase [Glycomyces sp. TRM65418]|uniref:spermidine synthase n=1 Tax=Glycomyces sp. TRM65418 TaxID=2867006 RepID=UPI001CE67E3B|nr:fused MFS/spermidine synthase [Glycomyces sp. TRM65418]MCC3762427.1 fused MFS/spermidine synthase [Glycomyces sp. TRM65418]QZD56472.1 fused MFS/spermidine synthase [Glycomyces sp. TRM65418]